MNLFELLIILDVTIPSEEARRIDVDKFPHCFLYSLQKYMYMYTHIYFDCVNQEPWLDIHVCMLYHIKIVLRLSVPLEPSQDFLEKN